MNQPLHYFVSGGSRGLGLEICRELLSMGYFVSTFARSNTEEVRLLGLAYPNQFLFSEIDITNQDVVEKFVAEAEKKLGMINGLVNNAAIGQDDLLVHMDPRKIENIVAVNILGTVNLTKAIVKKMLMGDGGKIIFISSICSSKGYPGLSIYSGSKGFMDAFSRSLVVELKRSSISINSISPGFFASETSSVLSQEQLDQIKSNTPSGKLTEIADVIATLKYLICAENTNGANIIIDGGATS